MKQNLKKIVQGQIYDIIIIIKKVIKIGLFIIMIQVMIFLYLSYRSVDDSGGISPGTQTVLRQGEEIQRKRRTKICTQVITPARHKETGEIRDFPTSCIPNKWIKIEPIM